jgi:hypothetical protein
MCVYYSHIGQLALSASPTSITQRPEHCSKQNDIQGVPYEWTHNQAQTCRLYKVFAYGSYVHHKYYHTKLTPWSESASELYRPSDRRLSANLVPTFVDRGCHLVNVTDPYGRIIGFLDRNRYFFFQVAPQLYSRG